MMREIWLPVVEFEGTYEVSNTGKIRRLATKGKPGSGNYAWLCTTETACSLESSVLQKKQAKQQGLGRVVSHHVAKGAISTLTATFLGTGVINLGAVKATSTITRNCWKGARLNDHKGSYQDD